MHPKLKAAIVKANAILTEMTSGEDSPAAERVKLQAMTKEELIEEVIKLKAKKLAKVKVEDMVYAIMCDEDCGVLNYATIAALVVKYRPGKTNAGNISFYASKAIEKGYDTVPRITREAYNEMIMYTETT